MTSDISIKPIRSISHGWQFSVQHAGRTFQITLSHQYWHKLTHRDIPPIDLLRLGLEEAKDRQIVGSLPAVFDFELLTTRIDQFEKRMRAEARTESSINQR